MALDRRWRTVLVIAGSEQRYGPPSLFTDCRNPCSSTSRFSSMNTEGGDVEDEPEQLKEDSLTRLELELAVNDIFFGVRWITELLEVLVANVGLEIDRREEATKFKGNFTVALAKSPVCVWW